MIGDYLETKRVNTLPRLPQEGSIDLTYRCNNNCRHCWLRCPSDSQEKENELSFAEIKKIVNEAKLIPLYDKREINKRLLACLIKPFVTPEWWEKTLLLVERISEGVPCYTLQFDKNGGVVEVLEQL